MSFKHVFNRGVDKRIVFMDRLDAYRFIKSLELFNTKEKVEFYELIQADIDMPRNSKIRSNDKNTKLVNIHAYCLCLNHYHLLLEDVAENGISLFMQKVGTGYTRYFNWRHKRSGSLFQGKYKKRDISTDEDLKNVSAYVHKNYHVHGIPSREKRLFSSYQELFDESYGIQLLAKNLVKLSQTYIDDTVNNIHSLREEQRKALIEDIG